MEIVKDQEQQATPPSYDPNKKYRWSEDDLFVVSGGEFGVLLNALRAVLNTPESQRILLAALAPTSQRFWRLHRLLLDSLAGWSVPSVTPSG